MSDAIRRTSLDVENPWPGLEAFREDDARFFRGRDAAAEELFRLVRRDRLTVLYGISGLGKSSLLQAGLFPRLREERLLPVYIRLAYDDNAPPLRQQLLDALARETRAHSVEAPAEKPGATLWEHFHRQDSAYWSADNLPVTPVLVIDQFEEAFTLGHHSAEIRARTAAFLEELGDLIEGRVPTSLREHLDAHPDVARNLVFNRHGYKILIGIREDFLAELETMRARVPSIAANRMRVTPLTGTAALMVTAAGGAELVPTEVGEQIVRLVAADDTGIRPLDELVVDPALLSLFCRALNERRKSLHQSSITPDLVEGNRDSILADFYETGLADLGPGVRSLLEERLLTVAGYRNSEALENALSIEGVTPDAVDTLVARRLIRREEREGRTRLELTHDVLTGVVRASRDQRRRAEDMRRAKKEAARQRYMAAAAARRLQRARMIATAAAFVAVVAGAIGVVAFREQRYSTVRIGQLELARAYELTNDENYNEALDFVAAALRHDSTSYAPRALAYSLLQNRFPMVASYGQGAVSPDGMRGFAEGDSLLSGPAAAVIRKLSNSIVNVPAFSPDSRLIAAVLADSTARIWNAVTGEPLGIPMRHGGIVKQLVFSADGNRILTATFTQTRMWDAHTGLPLGSNVNHGSMLRKIASSPDAAYFLAVKNDSARLISGPTGLAVGPQLWFPERIARYSVANDGRVLLALHDSSVVVVNGLSGARMGTPMLHGSQVPAAAFDDSGERILSREDAGTVRIWNARSGSLVATIRSDHRITAARFIRGDTVATLTERRVVDFWSGSTGAQVWRRVPSDSLPVLSPDGARMLTLSGGYAILRDTRTGTARGLPMGTAYAGASFSTDGKRVITKSGVVWDISADVDRTVAHHDGAQRLQFNSTGTRLASVGRDSVIQLWDAATLRAIPLEMPIRARTPDVFSPDGRYIVASTEDPSRVQVWDADNAKRVGAPLVHGGRVSSAAFSADGHTLATGATDGIVRVWTIGASAPPLQMRHRGPVNTVGFSPDGSKLVSGSSDSTAQVWNPSTGARIGPALQHDGAVEIAGFRGDGLMLVTMSSVSATSVDLHLWDAATLSELEKKRRYPHDTRLVFGTKELVAVWRDSAIFFGSFDSAGFDRRSRMKHQDSITSVVIAPGGLFVLTASADRSVRRWDKYGGSSRSIMHDTSVAAARFSPDGDRMATAADGTVQLWIYDGVALGIPVKHDRAIVDVAFTIDGSEIADLDASGAIEKHQTVDPYKLPSAEMAGFIEALRGGRIDRRGIRRNIDFNVWEWWKKHENNRKKPPRTVFTDYLSHYFRARQ